MCAVDLSEVDMEASSSGIERFLPEPAIGVESNEETAQAEHDGLVTDSKTNKEPNEKDIDHKSAKKQDGFQVSLTHAQLCRARCPTGYAAAVTWKEVV
eukprot:12961756-Heterocapsa_arctica.AAC.1